MTDQSLDASFFFFHTSWIVFNCVGWIWRRTRRWHLMTVTLTGVSWFGLGIWFGWGYCPCTDWHAQVRTRLGHQDPGSYIQLLAHELMGLNIPRLLADTLAVVTFGIVAALSVALNLRDRRGTRQMTANALSKPDP